MIEFAGAAGTEQEGASGACKGSVKRKYPGFLLMQKAGIWNTEELVRADRNGG